MAQGLGVKVWGLGFRVLEQIRAEGAGSVC